MTKASKTPRNTQAAATSRKKRIGFVGLGIMGSAMSGNLMQAGFGAVGYDPSAAARRKFAKAGGTVCDSTDEVAAQVDVIIFSLPSASALMAASEAALHGGKKGLLIVETSTLDIRDKLAARDLLATHGITLLDCPLSGTGAQARRKDLSIYSSGPAQAVKRLKPVFDTFSKANYYLGDFGNGMKMKLMANLLVAVHNVSTAEVLVFGQRYGIAPALAVKVLADGAGGSRMLDVRGPMMAKQRWTEATMKVSTWQKDMQLIAAALAQTQTPAPLFSAALPIYNAAMGAGHGDHDTAAVFDVLSRMCGTPPPSR